MSVFLIAVGLLLLFLGGEIVLRGAVLVALRLRVSQLMIGLTVVSFGTSTPELVTSLESAAIGASGIAVGNIVGSNIANALLILGICAVIYPFACPARQVLRDGALMLGAALAVTFVAFSGTIGRVEGALLTLGIAGYLWFLKHADVAPAGSEIDAAGEKLKSGWLGAAFEIFLVAVGIGLVVTGGHLLVTNAIDLAESLGVSETTIGLTVVAIGTSLPELATSLVAAFRRNADICYGNIVGSNIFNLLGIAGVTALTTPVSVSPDILSFDLPVMIAACLLMSLFAWTGGRLTRGEGAVLLAGYGAYLSVVVR